MTLQEVKKLVFLAIANFPNMQDRDMQATVLLWQKLLADMSFEQAQAALTKVLITAKFFPTVAEIRDAAESLRKKDGDPPSAEEAWLEVISTLDPYKAPKYSHDVIHQAVRVLGYRNICDSERPGVDRAQFMKIYDTLVNRKKEDVKNNIVLTIAGNMPKMLGGV